jgi:hypothetical protein
MREKKSQTAEPLCSLSSSFTSVAEKHNEGHCCFFVPVADGNVLLR